MDAKTKGELLALAAKHTEEQGCAAFVERAGRGMMLAYGSDTDIARLLQFPLDAPPHTPQPDGGDGAVLWVSRVELVTAVRRANDDRRVSSVRAYNCEEASLLRDATPLYTRPSAAAAVPEGFVQRVRNDLAAWIDTYGEGHIDAENLLAECDAMLAAAPAAPAAPKGGEPQS